MKLYEYLGSLSIEGASQSTFRSIIEAGYTTVESILSMSKAQLSAVPTANSRIGERANLIFDSLQYPENQRMMRNADLWVREEKESLPLEPSILKRDVKGLTVALTGAGPAPRGELAKRIEAAGGKVASSVTRGVNLLIMADPNSTHSKATKARVLGVELVSYESVF